MSWNRIARSAPIVAPLDTSRVREALGIVHTSDDTRIANAILAAASEIEGPDGAGLVLKSSTWTMVCDDFPADFIQIPVAPVTSITSIHYLDTSDVQQTLAGTQFDALSGRIYRGVGQSWPATSQKINAVTVTFVAGWADADLPPDLLRAVESIAINIFENPDAIVVGSIASELPLGPRSIIERYRRGRFG